MAYVSRNSEGVITGVFRHLAPGVAEEYVQDDSPELLVFATAMDRMIEEGLPFLGATESDKDAQLSVRAFRKGTETRAILEILYPLVNDYLERKGQEPLSKIQFAGYFQRKLRE